MFVIVIDGDAYPLERCQFCLIEVIDVHEVSSGVT